MDRTLGRLSQMLGLLSASAFVLSVIYQWGYFIAIDISLLSLLTLQDYFVGAIVTLPPLIVSAVVSSALVLYWRGPGYAEKRKAEVATAVQTGRGPRGTNLKQAAFWFLVFGVLLAVLSFLFFPSNFPALFVIPPFLIYVGVIMDLVAQTPDAKLIAIFVDRSKLFSFLVAFTVPVVALFVFLTGMTIAYSDVRRTPSVEMKRGADGQSEGVVFVRKLGGGVIYRRATTEEMTFETVEPQLTFTVKARSMSRNSWSCLDFGWPCLFPQHLK